MTLEIIKILITALLSLLVSACTLHVGIDRMPDKGEGGSVGVHYSRDVPPRHQYESAPTKLTLRK